ncbi:MAG: carboxypeptidase-like regulatory domain-containing protein [Terracidiphilus sp.]
MLSRTSFRSFAIATALVAVSGISLSAQDSAHRGRKYKPPPPTSRIEVTVVRDTDSKPVENASVIFHLDGDKGNMELKTNEDGKSVIDVLPMGSTMRMQIIAKGYQTYGQDYKIDKSDLAFGIRLKRPGEQYSIYKNHDQDADAQKSPKSGDSSTPKDAPAVDAAPPAATDKPSDSAAQPTNPPSKPQ